MELAGIQNPLPHAIQGTIYWKLMYLCIQTSLPFIHRQVHTILCHAVEGEGLCNCEKNAAVTVNQR